MAFKWIGGGSVDHPMADARQARQIVDGLPTNDPARALLEVTEWLESLNQTEGFKLNRRFENVGLLEAAVKNHQRKLVQDYLSTSRQQKFQENRLWNCVFGFWRQLGSAYVLCIREYDSGFSGVTTIRISLPVIMARALRALALQLKWALFRYGPVEPRIWAEVAGLYRLAEQRGVAKSTITIYPGEGGSTLQREFLKAVMLAVSSLDNLLPMRQEIAERAIAHFVGAFRLSDVPEGCTHGFDLALSRPPVRLIKGTEPTETLRYFGAGEALAGLDRLTARIVESREVPAEVGLGGSHDPEAVTGVLRHLAQIWSDKPPTRSAERRQTAGRITVVPGLKEILGTLRPSESDDLDFSQRSSAESWIVENASDGNYGAIIPARKSDWLRLGALVGVKSEISDAWAVGLVRRISSDEHQQRRVGIQLLTRAAVPVGLSKANSMSSLDFDISEQPAVLLSASPDDQGEVGVLLHGGAFNSREALDMTFRDQTIRLMPSKIIEAGEDFDWAAFKVTQRIA